MDLKNKWYYIVFIVIGGIAGYLYWHYIGCNSGACPLKANWYFNVALGLFGGYLIGDAINDFKKKREKKREQEHTTENTN